MRIRVFEGNLRDHSRILRIAHIENRSAEPLLVWDVADVGEIPRHRYLPRARQIQVGEAGYVAGEGLGGAVHGNCVG